MSGPVDYRSLYGRYLDACNRHSFEELGEFVADDVVVNGEQHGPARYVAGLRAVTRAFPDYRGELRHLVVEGEWIAAQFFDSGTHERTFLGIEATGMPVKTQEFAFYRFAESKICEVWVTADNLKLVAQMSAVTEVPRR